MINKMERWLFKHKFGRFELHSLGGMLGPVVFNLGERKVSPMFEAPWIGEVGINELKPLIQNLLGEFPCVPFGKKQQILNPDPEWKSLNLEDKDELLHGYSAHNHWKLVEQNEIEITIEIVYPEDSPIRKLIRRIKPSADKPALNIELIVEPRQNCRLPIGLHPIFKLPKKIESLQLFPGEFKFGLTFPGQIVHEGLQLRPNTPMASLRRVNTIDGGFTDLSSLPLQEPIECLVQLCGTDGTFELFYSDEDYHVRLDWDKTDFPSCLLWLSNKAIPSYPWNARTMALGIEPVNSAFDLGNDVSVSENQIMQNGISTFNQFFKDKYWKTKYCISVY